MQGTTEIESTAQEEMKSTTGPITNKQVVVLGLQLKSWMYYTACILKYLRDN